MDSLLGMGQAKIMARGVVKIIQEHFLSRSNRTLVVLCLMLSLWGVAELSPGSGVQSSLDARSGVSQKAFAESLDKAEERMSPAQIRALSWALGRLDSETFMSRYGEIPTVRRVIVGEVMGALDVARQQITSAELALGGLARQVEESEAHRRDVLKSLKTITPVITQVINPRGGGGEEIVVRYRVANPLALPLKSLPCRMVYHARHRNRVNEITFDCLSQPAEQGGDFYVRLGDVLGLQSSDMVISLVAMHEVIDVSSLEPPLRALSGKTAPAIPPQVEELRRARDALAQALRFKSSV